MVHTVALLGANGRIGGQVLPHLLKAHQAGTIKLVLLTRPGGKINNLDASAGIPVREVDLENPDSLEKGIQGVNVVLTTVGMQASMTLAPLVDALSRSPDAVTFIPSRFASNFFPSDGEKFPPIAHLLQAVEQTDQQIKAKGVHQTRVLSGVFHDFFFGYNFVNVDLKNNKIEANAKQLQNPFPITNTEDLAKGLAELVQRDPHSIKDKTFAVISHWVTGNEMVDVFTKVNGSKPEVVDYDEKAEQALLQGPFGPVPPVYKLHWEKGPEAFGYENQIKVEGGRTFEQTARDALEE